MDHALRILSIADRTGHVHAWLRAARLQPTQLGHEARD